jgi:type IV pilus assembly protein PilP
MKPLPTPPVLNIRAASLAAALTLILCGCSLDDHNDLKQELGQLSKDLRGRVDPLPVVTPYQPATYDIAEQPDPFMPARLEPVVHGGNAAANRLRPDLNRPKQVLEGYPLESLKLVGVWRRGKDVYALIKADAVVHPVKTGSYLGSNFGMVIAIRDNEVLLRELIQDASGEWAERRTELTMQSGGAGK